MHICGLAMFGVSTGPMAALGSGSWFETNDWPKLEIGGWMLVVGVVVVLVTTVVSITYVASMRAGRWRWRLAETGLVSTGAAPYREGPTVPTYLHEAPVAVRRVALASMWIGAIFVASSFASLPLMFYFVFADRFRDRSMAGPFWLTLLLAVEAFAVGGSLFKTGLGLTCRRAGVAFGAHRTARWAVVNHLVFLVVTLLTSLFADIGPTDLVLGRICWLGILAFLAFALAEAVLLRQIIRRAQPQLDGPKPDYTGSLL